MTFKASHIKTQVCNTNHQHILHRVIYFMPSISIWCLIFHFLVMSSDSRFAFSLIRALTRCWLQSRWSVADVPRLLQRSVQRMHAKTGVFRPVLFVPPRCTTAEPTPGGSVLSVLLQEQDKVTALLRYSQWRRAAALKGNPPKVQMSKHTTVLWQEAWCRLKALHIIRNHLTPHVCVVLCCSIGQLQTCKHHTTIIIIIHRNTSPIPTFPVRSFFLPAPLSRPV